MIVILINTRRDRSRQVPGETAQVVEIKVIKKAD